MVDLFEYVYMRNVNMLGWKKGVETDLKGAVRLFVILMLAVIPVLNVFSLEAFSEVGFGVHNLDTGLNYESIHEAIRANETFDGHTILVDEGVYREKIVVDKSISLVAEEGSMVVIDGEGNGTIITVVADNVSITGFVIQNSGMDPDSFGLSLNRSSRCIIKNNLVTNSYYSVRLYYAHNNTLLNNTVSNSSYGVWMAYSERNVLLYNRAFDNEHVGFHLYPASNNLLRGNEAWNNEHGIYIFSSKNNTALENLVHNNTYGIWFGGSTNNTVDRNEVYNNTYGVRLTASTANLVSGNSFEENDVGVSLRDNSSDNLVFHNNFLSNTEQARSVESVNPFDFGMEGNCWSDYDGFDNDNDGIGDVAYVIDENNTDRYPLMGRFSGFSAVLEEEEYSIHVVSNCSVSGFEFFVEVQILKFRVSGLNGSVCFCRAMFPRILLAGPYMVVVDGVEVDAVLLPASNISHVFLYFAFNMSSHEVAVASRHFYTLWEEYSALMNAHSDLIANYTMLLDDFYTLNNSYNDLRDNYADLQSNLDSLQSAYDVLNSTYNDLLASYETVEGELEGVRLFMYGFLVATVFGAVVSLVSLRFFFKYHRGFSEQRRIIEAYGISPLDVARAFFELDVKKRGEKIEKFEEKYGVKIRPRASLEDIVKSLESEKKRRKRG